MQRNENNSNKLELFMFLSDDKELLAIFNSTNNQREIDAVAADLGAVYEVESIKKSKTAKWVLYILGGIVVLFVLSIFLSVIQPNWFRSAKDRQEIKERGYRWESKSNLEQIGLGLIMYAHDNSGKFPDKLSELHPDYNHEVEKFFYPDEKKKIMTPENIDSLGCFEYFGAGLTQDAAPDIGLVREKSINHWSSRGRLVLFVDSHVEWHPVTRNFVSKTIHREKIVIDDTMSLMWRQNGSSHDMDWKKAKQWIRDLNSRYAGYSDWRLPTVEEGASLLESSKMYGGLYIDPLFD
ncbi:MAG: DUF1566 domain-containing protein [Candidatus Scalindua sp.]|nr:DUF1566 domain-containing protein [Candidatus Scalindua sp.]